MTILREELITNHLLLDYFDMWDEFDIKSANDTREVRYYNQLMNLIESQLDAGIRWLDSNDAKDYFRGESEYQQEVFRALEDEWDSILEGKYSSVDALLSEVYRRGKSKGYSDMRSHIRYTETDKLALDFVTNYNFRLIQNIDSDVRSQIKGKIISGFLAGENPNVIAPKISAIAGERLDGSNFTPKQRATMIARTEISRVQNTGILQSYVNEGITEVKILTAEDDNVCDLCLKYAFEFNEDDDLTFENRGEERVHNISKLIKGGRFPPFHPLCRCTYLSVWRSKENPPENPEIMDLISYAPNRSYNQNFSYDAIEEFNELKDNPNIKWSIDEQINFNRDGLYNNETFIKYYFKDTDITIYKSLFNDVASVKEIHQFFNGLPKELTPVCKEIVLSHQMLKRVIKGKTKYVGGFTRKGSFDRITILDKPNLSIDEIERIIIHELAHTIDGNDYIYSNHPDFIKAFEIDKTRLDNISILDEEDKYISENSADFTPKAINGGFGKDRPYSEDFADCVIDYFKEPDFFFWKFPEKAKYINNIFHIYNTNKELNIYEFNFYG